MVNQDTPLDADDLAIFADRIEALPPDDAEWVARLWREVLRLRALETAALTQPVEETKTEQTDDELDEHVAQVALDTAEWLKTLWNVGYMGAGSFRAEPRSTFPTIDLEDVRRSSLFARIRHGKHVLPFPPPTRQGSPWHELVEDSAAAAVGVNAEIIRDESGAALGAIIEGCADWEILAEVSERGEFIVQHQGKGPKYRLLFAENLQATLQREPPQTVCTIQLHNHGGLASYTLEWPAKDGKLQMIPLRAATWARATAEADYWLATTHPEMYGQIRFEKRAH